MTERTLPLFEDSEAVPVVTFQVRYDTRTGHAVVFSAMHDGRKRPPTLPQLGAVATAEKGIYQLHNLIRDEVSTYLIACEANAVDPF